MQIWKTRLSVLLICQLLLAGCLWALTYRSNSTGDRESKLLSFNKESVDKIEVWQGEKSVTISKGEARWTLPGLYDLPAGKEKVDALLRELEELAVGAPETATSSSHERLGLGETPQGRLKLYQEDQVVAELLLGKTPSFEQRYLRLASDEQAYRAKFGGVNLQATEKSWLADDLLKTDSPERVTFPTFEIAKDGDLWKSGEKELEPARVTSLLSQLQQLRVVDAAGIQVPWEATKIQVELKDKAHTYLLFQDSGKKYLKRDDFEPVFQIPDDSYQRLAEAKLNELIKP